MEDKINFIRRSMSFPRMMIYIFIPPLLTMILYVLLSVGFHNYLPTLLLFFIAASMILFPTQVYLILNESKKQYGFYSFRSAFQNQKTQPWWLILILGMLTFGFAGLMTVYLMPIEASLFNTISENLFNQIPDYFNWNNIIISGSYPKSVLIATAVFYIILNGFVGPIVEELFFRGFLTEKLKINNWIAPFVMTILFSIYHFWLPFDLIFRIIAFYPAFYLAWKLKNIKISIVFHCLSNVFTAIMFLLAILSL